MSRPLLLAGAAIAAVIVAVVVCWPRQRTGPEPIAYGRDTCAHCRMHLARPGFAGELRDAEGRLTTYDDIGCLLQAMLARHREVPEAWVEDHASGEMLALLAAHLVHAPGLDTPMGHGIVAFRDEAAAAAFAREHAGAVVRIEDLLREPKRWAPRPVSKGSEGLR